MQVLCVRYECASEVCLKLGRWDVDALEKVHPRPEAFAAFSQGMKSAVAKMQGAVESVVKTAKKD